jgi:hypothetical protein
MCPQQRRERTEPSHSNINARWSPAQQRRGIGAAIVKRLAREGVGVALTYVSKPDQANATVQAAQAFAQALAIHADSADAKAALRWSARSPSLAALTFWSTTRALG